MGAKNSTTMKSTLQFVSNTTFSSIVSVQSKCKTTSNSTQNLSLDVKTDPSVLKTCLQYAAPIGYDCSKLMANATINGVSQAADLQITANCSFDDSSAAQLQASVSAALQSKMSDTSDAVGAALQNITQAIGGKNNTNVDLKQTLSNTVTSSMSSSTVNEMISAYTTAQNANITVDTAEASIASISQFTQLKAVSDMLAKNAVVVAAASTVDAQLAAQESKQSKGLTDIVDSAAGVVNNAVDKGTGVANNAIFGLSTVWIAIGGAVIVAAVLMLWLLTRKGPASKTVDRMGNTNFTYGPSFAGQALAAAPGFMQQMPMGAAMRRF